MYWWWLLEKPVGLKEVEWNNSLFSAPLSLLLGEQNSLDVGQYTSLSNGDARQQLVQFLVVPDGELKMPGVDPLFFVVTSSVASQLEDLSGEVLHDGSQVDWSAGSHTFGVVALFEKTVDTSNWELESCTSRAGLGLGAGLASLSTSRHS